MKTILAGIAASLALTSLSIAHADDMSVQIKSKSPQRYHMVEQDFFNFNNVYLLENGQRIAFTARMSMFYTQLADGARVRIYPISSRAFVTENGARIEFREQGETVGIANFEKLSPASQLAANTTMTARR
ncbi:gel scht [Pseudoduganella sp. FT55W]|uniref:Gel scht n=1 Tax=Duganella rivi TaxID=2666083 RepID=A0A7X4GUJ9_9BURK|nr:gel scht [Duganella rivi]MYM69987.1 gel scht [Duganella rivi]